MIIDKNLLDQHTTQAMVSPRLRQHYDLRNSSEDNSQRILNALEPGTVLSMHRHAESLETLVMLRGKGRWNYYGESGNRRETFLLSADGCLCQKDNGKMPRVWKADQ